VYWLGANPAMCWLAKNRFASLSMVGHASARMIATVASFPV